MHILVRLAKSFVFLGAVLALFEDAHAQTTAKVGATLPAVRLCAKSSCPAVNGHNVKANGTVRVLERSGGYIRVSPYLDRSRLVAAFGDRTPAKPALWIATSSLASANARPARQQRQTQNAARKSTPEPKRTTPPRRDVVTAISRLRQPARPSFRPGTQARAPVTQEPEAEAETQSQTATVIASDPANDEARRAADERAARELAEIEERERQARLAREQAAEANAELKVVTKGEVQRKSVSWEELQARIKEQGGKVNERRAAEAQAARENEAKAAEETARREREEAERRAEADRARREREQAAAEAERARVEAQRKAAAEEAERKAAETEAKAKAEAEAKAEAARQAEAKAQAPAPKPAQGGITFRPPSEEEENAAKPAPAPTEPKADPAPEPKETADAKPAAPAASSGTTSEVKLPPVTSRVRRPSETEESGTDQEDTQVAVVQPQEQEQEQPEPAQPTFTAVQALEIGDRPKTLTKALLDERLSKLPGSKTQGPQREVAIALRHYALALLKSGECSGIARGGRSAVPGMLYVACTDDPTYLRQFPLVEQSW